MCILYIYIYPSQDPMATPDFSFSPAETHGNGLPIATYSKATGVGSNDNLIKGIFPSKNSSKNPFRKSSSREKKSVGVLTKSLGFFSIPWIFSIKNWIWDRIPTDPALEVAIELN